MGSALIQTLNWTQCTCVRDNEVMKTADKITDHKLQMLVLERRDKRRNMARFYVLAIEPTLLNDTALVREWGRIGSLGRRCLELHADEATAVEALEVWLARKQHRGYQVTASTIRFN